MGFHNVAFLPPRASFSTTFPKHCGRGKGLWTTTYLKTEVGGRQGHAPPCKILLVGGRQGHAPPCKILLVGGRQGHAPPCKILLVGGRQGHAPPCKILLVGGRQGHAPCKILLLQLSLFLCQLNFMEIERLSQS